MSSPRTAAEKIHDALGHRAMLWVCMFLGLVLASPALDAGLVADDVGHRAFILAKLAGQTDAPWWDIFVLVGASPEELEKLRYLGSVPWWSSTEVRVALWRPLTAATHYLDYWLWPEQPWLMHLHQLLWHAGACGLVWALFRRLSSSPAAAGAAALGFSLTHLHLAASGWLAQRNAVLAVVFVLASLIAHDRWRREGWRAGAVLGPLAFLAALLSSEMGVAGLGFVLAYPLWYERERLARGVTAVGGFVLTLVVWRLVYDALGYGAFGSGTYIDPIRDFGRWLGLMPGRVVELMIFALGPPSLAPAWSWERVVPALAVLGSLVGLGFMSRRDLARTSALGFAACAMLASMIPLTTIAAHDRVLILPTAATTMAFGELLAAALVNGALVTRIGAAVVALVHYLLSPALGVAIASYVNEFKLSGPGHYHPIAASLDNERLRQQSLVILHAPTLLTGTLVPRARVLRNLERPNFCWVLHAEPGPGPLVEQLDERTLVLTDKDGWARSAETMMLRGRSDPFVVGQRINTLDFSVEVLAVDDGRATQVAVEFRRPIADKSFAMVSWAGDDFAGCEGGGVSCWDETRGAPGTSARPLLGPAQR